MERATLRMGAGHPIAFTQSVVYYSVDKARHHAQVAKIGGNDCLGA